MMKFCYLLLLPLLALNAQAQSQPQPQPQPFPQGHSMHGSPATVSPAGHPAPDGEPQRLIKVSLLDSMQIIVNSGAGALSAGEVVQFAVTNRGAQRHEFSLATAAEHRAHANMMRDMPQMVHSSARVLSLAPGETKTLNWVFSKPGEVLMACDIYPHFDRGMHKTLTVSAADHHSQQH